MSTEFIRGQFYIPSWMILYTTSEYNDAKLKLPDSEINGWGTTVPKFYANVDTDILQLFGNLEQEIDTNTGIETDTFLISNTGNISIQFIPNDNTTVNTLHFNNASARRMYIKIHTNNFIEKEIQKLYRGRKFSEVIDQENDDDNESINNLKVLIINDDNKSISDSIDYVDTKILTLVEGRC